MVSLRNRALRKGCARKKDEVVENIIIDFAFLPVLNAHIK
jgi:hypothetical protein